MVTNREFVTKICELLPVPAENVNRRVGIRRPVRRLMQRDMFCSEMTACRSESSEFTIRPSFSKKKAFWSARLQKNNESKRNLVDEYKRTLITSMTGQDGS